MSDSMRTMPGATHRNGMPPGGGYAYQGTGQDVLTPPGVMAAWNNRARALAGISAAPRSQAELDRVAEAERVIALGTVAQPLPPRAARELSRADAPEPARGQLPLAAPPPPAGRCGGCGYQETARGHLAACGDGAS